MWQATLRCQVSSYTRTSFLFIDIPEQGHQTISKHFLGKGPKCYIKWKTSLQPKAQDSHWALSKWIRNPVSLKREGYALCSVALMSLFAFLFERSWRCSLFSQQRREGRNPWTHEHWVCFPGVAKYPVSLPRVCIQVHAHSELNRMPRRQHKHGQGQERCLLQ